MAAIVAVVHDVLVCLGALSIANRELSLPVLAALLTIIGYSVNDTIVAFDRIRENRGQGLRKGQTLRGPQMNTAINQTLSRTILTVAHGVPLAAVLFFFGRQGAARTSPSCCSWGGHRDLLDDLRRRRRSSWTGTNWSVGAGAEPARKEPQGGSQKAVSRRRGKIRWSTQEG